MVSKLLKQKHVTKIFILFFIIINFFIFLFIYQQNEHRKDFLEVMDTAGKQRFYSQYIMQKAYSNSFEINKELQVEILKTCESMSKDLEYLHKTFYYKYPKLEHIYTVTKEFLDYAEEFANKPNSKIFIVLNEKDNELLPSLLDAVITLKEDFLKKQETMDLYMILLIIFIIASSAFFAKYIFMPSMKMLKASYEGQIVVDNFSQIIDFNSVAKDMFNKISKGMMFYDMLDIEAIADGEEGIVFESSKAFTFKHKGKYYKIFTNKINKKHSVINVFDVSELVKESIRKDTIYNSQNSIVVVTDGINIKEINQAFFETFDFENKYEFTSKHSCICELFCYKKGYEYIQKEVNGLPWNKYIGENPDKVHEVLMINKFGKERIYKVKTSGDFFDLKEKEEVVVFTDITELKEKNDLLIMQSKDAAIGEMISMIAHQWRQPLSILSTILSRIKIQKDMGMLDDESFKAAIVKANSQISYMSKTIDDFREFFKNSEVKELIKVQSIVEVPKNLVESLLKSKDISFDVEYSVDLDMEIETNISKISQVFLNIYKNAIDQIASKEIENGFIKVHMFLDKEYLYIDICDNAGGIKEESIDRIFEAYYSTKSKNGTGLGLYMSKKIAQEILRGDLEVFNKDKGACFRVSIKV